MENEIRWGIVGTGRIARKFASGLAHTKDARLVAVASRTKESADRFAGEFADPFGEITRHVGVAALANDDSVDVVYIATPHPMHKDGTLQCLHGGKAVLCEKPFAMNVAEAEEMIECARANRLFLMEAMWSHFFPAMAKVREIIASGAIGDVRLLQSSFCCSADWDPSGRLLSPALGGGALLDVGIYNVALAQMVFQKPPTQINSTVHLGETGVDEQSSVTLGYDGGAMAVLTSSIRTSTRHDAAIYGSEGSIVIPHMFWRPEKIVFTPGLAHGQGHEEELCFPQTGNGYNYEAGEVGDCLRRGALESPIMPLDTTLAHLRIMDSIRQQWGLVYPMEKS